MSRTTEQLPSIPYSLEAEQGAIACALLDPNLVPDLRLHWFHDLRHITLVRLMQEMSDAGHPVDTSTLGEQLIQSGTAKEVGGLAYLATLPEKTPSAANWTHWRAILEGKAILRGILAVCRQAEGEVAAGEREPEALLERFEATALSVRQTKVVDEADLRGLLAHVGNELEAAMLNRGQPIGLQLGYPSIDRLTTGLRPGQVFVLAGRPSTGKTSLAMNIAERAAIDRRLPVAVFTCEMTATELLIRLVTSRAGIDSAKARRGEMTEADLRQLTRAIGQASGAPLHIIDAAGLALPQIRARARRLNQRQKLALVVVDYLGLVHSGAGRVENRNVEISMVSAGLKNLAKEVSAPLLALAQLNRGSEREDRRPRLSDLRDSGSIEQDGDLVAFLHPGEHDGKVEFLLAKNRSGPCDCVKLYFRKELTRFSEVAYERE